MLIDTHAHLNFNAFKNDADEVIRHSLAENVWMINVGSKYKTSRKAVEIAQKYEKGVFAAIGLHPIYSTSGLVKIKTDPDEGGFEAIAEDFDEEKYKELAKSEKVVAIGEIGLDYYYKPKTKTKLSLFKETQKQVFLKQLDLAEELDLPVIFHCRMAFDDLLEILRKTKLKNPKFRGVVHCFTGNWDQAKECLSLGFYLGFNGIIFKEIKGVDFKENIRNIPLDRILLETDCPYLTPPMASAKRNEPLFIKHVAEEVAKIKEISFEELSRITTENAKKLFGI